MMYSKNCIPTSHNSFASSSNGFMLWPQQHLSIKDQLAIGVRGFMLDIYYLSGSGQIVLRHGASGVNGVAKPISGKDLLFYDTFEEFTDFLDYQAKVGSCATITILLESYVNNQATYTALDKSGLASKYLYKNNPNLATLKDVCNKIVLFTSHDKGIVNGIHLPKIYKENHYQYYKDGSYLLKYEECEDREQGRAKYTDPDVDVFCFNHFSPISALIERSILIKPLLYNLQEGVDKGLEKLGTDYRITHSSQDSIKAYGSLKELTKHLDKCSTQNIKNSFFPTIIAVDFIEKDSGVFLCCKDSECLQQSTTGAISYDYTTVIGLVGSAIVMGVGYYLWNYQVQEHAHFE